jgi:hypothetical protein
MHPRIAATSVTVGAIFGAMSHLMNLVSSPHYGWLLHRWAVFFVLAVVSTILGLRLGSRRIGWIAFILLTILALSAVDPLRRILIYDAWWDA